MIKFNMPKVVQEKLLPQLIGDSLKAKRSFLGVAIINKDGSTIAMHKWLNKKVRASLLAGQFDALFNGINSLDEKKKYKLNVFTESRMIRDVNSKRVVPCQVVLIEE